MQINVSCESNTNKDFIYNLTNIEDISFKMLKYVFNLYDIEFFSDEYTYNFDITICDNEFIKSINKKYRNIDNATDVITFAMFWDSEEKIIIDSKIYLGQILISLDKVYSQAKENNVLDAYEFLNLLAHGILHLIGFDHQTEDTLCEMLDLQKQMIKDTCNVEI